MSSLRLQGVSKTFSRTGSSVTALDGVDLVGGDNDFIALLGPSGCGKSTLLRIIAGLIEPTSGQVEVLGGAPADARKDRRISFVFQQAALLPWRTALDNVSLPLQVGPDEVRSSSGLDPREALDLVGLDAFADSYPHELSGGMQQRVSIARALVTAPDLLLMDEPFGALDEITREGLNDQLLDLWAQSEMTVVFVTHSIPEAAYLARKVAVMSARPGRIGEVVELDADVPRPADYRLSNELAEKARQLRAVMEAV